MRAIKNGERDEAIAYLLESLEFDHKDDAVFLALGFLYLKKKDYNKAEEYLDRSITKSMQKYKGGSRAIAWIALGQVYFETKQYRLMSTAFKEAQAHLGENGYSLYPSIAGALDCLGQHENAEEIVKLAERHNLQAQMRLSRIDFATACGNYELAKKLSTDRPSLGIHIMTGGGKMFWICRMFRPKHDKRAIDYLWEGGFADLAGLQVGDIITEVNGIPLEKKEPSKALQSSKYGDTVTLLVKRGSSVFPSEVVLDYDYYLSRKASTIDKGSEVYALSQKEHTILEGFYNNGFISILDISSQGLDNSGRHKIAVTTKFLQDAPAAGDEHYRINIAHYSKTNQVIGGYSTFVNENPVGTFNRILAGKIITRTYLLDSPELSKLIHTSKVSLVKK